MDILTATTRIKAVCFITSGVRGLLKELKIMHGRVILRMMSTSFSLESRSMSPTFMQYIPTAR